MRSPEQPDDIFSPEKPASQPPTQEDPEQAKLREEKYRRKLNTWERLKPFRGPILALAVEIGALVGAGAEKVGEYQRLQEFTEVIPEQERELQDLNAKYEKVKRIFGENYQPYYLVLEKSRGVIEKRRNELMARREARDRFSLSDLDRFTKKGATRLEKEFKEERPEPPLDKDPAITELLARDPNGKERLYPAEVIKQGLAVLPESWVKREIAMIRRSPSLPGAPEAICVLGSGEERSEIIFNDEIMKNYSLNHIFDILYHEIAHANDWGCDAEMSDEERLELLYRVAERFQAPDRYHSNYVESIQGSDKQLEVGRKALEYWAKICEVYFSDPDRLHIKDFQLVDDQVRKTDPNFDLRKRIDEHKAFLAIYNQKP